MTAPTIRVLLVEDDQGDYLMTRAMLDQIEGARVDLEWVSTYREAVASLDRHADFDVMLVDYFLEDHDGLDVVREARARKIRTPMIMLTGRGSREVDVEAMKAGASDYLVKGEVDPDTLERAIRYALERRRAEEALRESEERHRGMFDHLPMGLYRCTPEGEFVDANPALVRILGHPDPDTLRSVYAPTLYVAPHDLDRFRATLEEQGVVRGFETTVRRRDGVAVRVRNTARAHRRPDGSIEYVEGVVEDVSDREEVERAMGAAEHFHTIFEASSLAIVLTDLDGRILDANPAFRRAFGYDRSVLGRRFSDLAVPEEKVRTVREHQGLLDQRGATPRSIAERRLAGGDGGVLWARTVSALVRDADGEPDHILVLLEDVAETGTSVGV